MFLISNYTITQYIMYIFCNVFNISFFFFFFFSSDDLTKELDSTSIMVVPKKRFRTKYVFFLLLN